MRVARRAGIVVIFEGVGNKAVFELRLRIKRPHLLVCPYTVKQVITAHHGPRKRYE